MTGCWRYSQPAYLGPWRVRGPLARWPAGRLRAFIPLFLRRLLTP